MLETIIKSIECQTMGHANCKKVLNRRGDQLVLDHYVHYVYNRRLIERP